MMMLEPIRIEKSSHTALSQHIHLVSSSFLICVSISADSRGDRRYAGAFHNPTPGTRSIACSIVRDGDKHVGD